MSEVLSKEMIDCMLDMYDVSYSKNEVYITYLKDDNKSWFGLVVDVTDIESSEILWYDKVSHSYLNDCTIFDDYKLMICDIWDISGNKIDYIPNGLELNFLEY